ncbi:MAP microtubule affinity-regulating kinase 1 [Gonapodya sp. JEL0774]|nr:MAP microtubule affinity-regulating kinase 1 [Gonapodya sp. JEL0774]
MSLLQRKKILGDYQIGKTIGQGAFSKVKIGYHKETGAKVAIKIIDKKQVAEKARKAKQVQEERDKRKREAEEKRQQQLKDMRAQDQKQWEQRQAHAQVQPESQPIASRSLSDGRRSATRSRQASFASETKKEREPEKVKEVEKEKSTEKANEPEKKSNTPGGGGAVDESSAPGVVKALQGEVQLLMRLDHPNIIKLYQVMENEDECYVVMEYAPGGELIDYIASRKHLSEKEARRFFRQIISAMDHCHSANVVHRDLKLENLLLSADRNILISDFGLGRTFNSEADDYMKTFCGTPNYAAVELISGIPYIGVKSDIWAMGVVLYIMMTGRPPFIGENISALYSKIRAVDYKCPDYFSTELRDILSRILVKDPSTRIDMSELRLHPWVMLEETVPPPIMAPKTPDPAQLISSIHHEDDYIIYTFRPHASVDGSEKRHKLMQAKAAVASAGMTASMFKRRASMQPAGMSPDPMAVGGVTGVEPSKSRVHQGITEEGEDVVAPLPSGPQAPARPQARSGRRLSLQISSSAGPAGPSTAPAMMEKSASTARESESPKRRATITVTLDDGDDTKRLSPTMPSVKIRAPSGGGRRESLGLPSGGPQPRAQANSGRNNIQVPQSANTFLRRASIATTEGQGSSRRHNRFATESDAMAAAVAANASKLANTSRASASKSATSEDDWDLEMGSHNAHRGSFLGDLANPSGVSASSTDSTSPVDTPDTLTRLPSTNSRDSEIRATSPITIAAGMFSDNKGELDDGGTEPTEDLPEPTKKEIEEWHMFHKPPKTIRSIRYAFSSNTTSSMPPQAVFQEVHRVLLVLAQMYGEDRFVFERISDYYVLQCKLYDLDHKRVEVAFEIEVAKVWLLKLHGVRIKRLMGEPLLFKEIYSNIIAELHL